MPACGRLIYPYWKLNSNATYKGVIKKKAKSFPILLLLTQFFRKAKVSYDFFSVTIHFSVSLTLLILELQIYWALDYHTHSVLSNIQLIPLCKLCEGFFKTRRL